MGWKHLVPDFENAPEPPPAPPPAADDRLAKLSELLEWERRQRAEAQARIAELEKELIDVRATSAAAEASLRGEVEASKSSLKETAAARDEACEKLHEQTARSAELAGLLEEAQRARDAALKELRAEAAAADASRARKRTQADALRTLRA